LEIKEKNLVDFDINIHMMSAEFDLEILTPSDLVFNNGQIMNNMFDDDNIFKKQKPKNKQIKF